MKLTLIERSALTFRSYVDGPIGAHFRSTEFLDGLNERRNEVRQQLASASGFLFLSTTVLAFFSNVSGTVTFLGASVKISSEFAIALSVLVAAALVATLMKLVDHLLLDRYVGEIGRSVGMFSFPLFMLNKAAINLWVDAITPRFFGPKSRRPQRAMMAFLAFFTLILFGVIFIYPAAICAVEVVRVFTSDGSWIEWFFASLTTLLLVFSAVLISVFVVKFTFDPADFDEADGKPTPEFIARITTEQEASKGPENHKQA